MDINIKGAPRREQIEVCETKKATSIELQLIKQIPRGEEYLDTTLDIKVLHPRIKNDTGLNTINIITPDRLLEVSELYEICKRIKDDGREVPMIVLHMSGKATDCDPKAMANLINRLNKTYNINPTFVIENITVLRKNATYDNGFYKEPVELVNALNMEECSSSFGTCLDICHAESSSRVVNKIGVTTLELEDFFRLYAPTCKLIHYNYLENLGMDPSEHSTKVTREIAEEIHRLYTKYNFKADITVEVVEIDYNTYSVFEETYNNMEGLFY